MDPEIMRALALMAPAAFEAFERGMQTVRRIRAEVAAEIGYERQMDRATRGIYSEHLRHDEYERWRSSLGR